MLLMLWAASCQPSDATAVAGPGALDTAAPHSDGADTRPDTSEPMPPNLLVVLLDDVGVDKIGAYGVHDQPAPTPTIDALAAEGLLFENAWTYPGCTPSRAALLTGRHATRTGLGRVLTPEVDGHWLLEDEVTVAEVLRAAPQPYATALVGKWHLVAWQHDSPADHPGLQGFDAVRGTLGNLHHAYDAVADEELDYDYWQKNVDGSLSFTTSYVTTDQADDVLALSQALPEPWFVLSAFSAPHEPFHAPPADLTTLTVADGDPQADLYAAMLESVDSELGRVLDTMDAGVRARTLVVVMGDNGSPRETVLDPARPERAKESLYDGGVHVPLIVSGPLLTEPGRRTDALVHVVDVFSTVAELAGVDVQDLVRTEGDFAGDAVTIDGRSWAGLLSDAGAVGPRDHLHVESFSPNAAGTPAAGDATVRSQRWKLIERAGAESELYRYDTADYAEGEDLASTIDGDAEAAEAFQALTSELERWRGQLAYGP